MNFKRGARKLTVLFNSDYCFEAHVKKSGQYCFIQLKKLCYLFFISTTSTKLSMLSSPHTKNTSLSFTYVLAKVVSIGTKIRCHYLLLE